MIFFAKNQDEKPEVPKDLDAVILPPVVVATGSFTPPPTPKEDK
jgi:hypothetical protein